MADFINVFISDIVLVFKKNNKNKLIFIGILLLSIIFAMVKLFAFGVTEEEYSSLLLIRFIKNEVSFWFFLILNLLRIAFTVLVIFISIYNDFTAKLIFLPILLIVTSIFFEIACAVRFMFLIGIIPSLIWLIVSVIIALGLFVWAIDLLNNGSRWCYGRLNTIKHCKILLPILFFISLALVVGSIILNIVII